MPKGSKSIDPDKKHRGNYVDKEKLLGKGMARDASKKIKRRKSRIDQAIEDAQGKKMDRKMDKARSDYDKRKRSGN